MNVLVYLLPMALGLGLTGLLAFVWSISNGQLDDLDGAALRVLADDDLVEQDPRLSGLDNGQISRGRTAAM